jgi:hypothetical protein
MKIQPTIASAKVRMSGLETAKTALGISKNPINPACPQFADREEKRDSY